MYTRRQLQSAISSEKSNLKDEEIFTSEAFNSFAKSICKGIGKIYNIPTFNINIYWGNENDKTTAYVDDLCRFVVNANNSILQGLSRKERFACSIGILCHEVSHRLWSNFKELAYIGECINRGKVIQRYQAKAINEYIKNFPNQKNAVANTFKSLANIIEDSYCEMRFQKTYIGFRKYLLSMRDILSKLDFSSFEAAQTSGSTINDIVNLIHLYAVNNISSSTLGNDEARECMEVITPYVNNAISEDNSKERLAKTLIILNEIIVFLEKKEEEKKNQQNPNNQKNSSNSNDNSSQSTSTDSSDSNQNPTEQSNDNDNSSQEPQSSSDDGDNNGSDTEGSEAANDGSSEGTGNSAEGSNTQDSSDNSNGSSDGTDSSDNSDASGYSENADDMNSDENEPAMDSDLRFDNADSAMPSSISTESNNSKFSPLDDSTPSQGSVIDNDKRPDIDSFDNGLNNLENEVAKEKVENNAEKEIQKMCNTLKDNMDFSDYHNRVRSKISRIPRLSAPSDFDELDEETRIVLKRLIGEWKKQIHDLQIGSNLNGLYSGRRLTQAYRTDLKRFSSKKAPEDIPDMSICLLVDLSGSMRGEEIQAAKKAAVLIYKFCKELDIRFSCVGHRVDYYNGVELFQFADFNSIDNNDLIRIASIEDYVHGCNRDGYALRYCEELLEKESSKQRILLVISDGAPNDDGYGFNYEPNKPSGYSFEQSGNAKLDILEIEKKCAKNGISIITAGISSSVNEIKDLYTYGVNKKIAPQFLEITDMTKMPKRFIDVLKKEIEKSA